MAAGLIQRLRAWSWKQIFIVVGAFLVYLLADGTTFSFGLYVDELIHEYHKLHGNIVLRTSVIAALSQSLPLLLSPLVCWLTRRFGASPTSLIGCIVSASGYVLPFVFQFTGSFWIPAAGYGCLLSVGLAFCYVSAYLTLPLYFKDDMGLATGLAVSGSGFGQVLLAVVVKACMIEYGWRGASLITGGLLLFMLIAVLAFRESSPSSPVSPAPDTVEVPWAPTISAVVNTEAEKSEDPPIRRSRGMTLAQILPMLISSVPVRASVSIPHTDTPAVRRHSLFVPSRTRATITDPSSIPTDALVQFQRARANTIALPFPTTRRSSASSDRLRQSSRLQPRAPIAFAEETSDEEEQSASIAPAAQPLTLRLPTLLEQVDIVEETHREKHWFLRGRFLLFCFSNFALCLVMGVPYVILPTYISETFVNQDYLASWTLSNVGIASALGQILLGYLHDRKVFAAWIMYTMAVIVSGASLIVLALFPSKVVVLTCAFMFGLAVSANYALQMLIVIDTISMKNMSTGFGILQFCQGVSTLIGIPLQGYLRDVSKTYTLSFVTSGFIIILSGLSMLLWPCFESSNTQENTSVDNDE